MKYALLFATLTCLAFAGCHDHGPDRHCVEVHRYTPPPQSTEEPYSEYIAVDSANKMISSYLGSISQDPVGKDDLHALIYNADSLRAFLTNNPTITNVKFMFAHTLDYINSGGQNKYAGYQSGALTLVLAGYDAQGNYVYFHYPQSQAQMVEDHCEPCPRNCPGQGTATSDTLPVQPTKRK